jgi:hypothetical protein
MGGSRWQNLIKVLRETLIKINNISQNSDDVKVTVINFNDNARIIYERWKSYEIDVGKITFTSGGTNFHHPFELAYQIIAKNVIQ